VRVTDYGTYLVAVDHTAAETFDPLDGNSAGEYYVQIAPPTTELSYTVTGTTFTPDANYLNGFVNCTNVAGCDVTLPATFENNGQVTFRQASDTAITFDIEPGENPIEGMFGYDTITDGRGSVVTCKFITDTWYIWGRLVPVSA